MTLGIQNSSNIFWFCGQIFLFAMQTAEYNTATSPLDPFKQNKKKRKGRRDPCYAQCMPNSTMWTRKRWFDYQVYRESVRIRKICSASPVCTKHGLLGDGCHCLSLQADWTISETCLRHLYLPLIGSTLSCVAPGGLCCSYLGDIM